jgi:repressor LexA
MTRKQAELRTYIKNYIDDNGYSPSFEEMMKGVGLKSKSGIHRLVEGLVKQGKIKRVKFTRRSVELANG